MGVSGRVAGIQNYAGNSRRHFPIGEVARRDARWLASLALEKMASEWRGSRAMGLSVFHQLTARSFGYRADTLAHERAESLKKLQGWWDENKEKSREEWLLSYFADKGFQMRRLWENESIPILCEALEADFFTHNLAVEQLSAITKKYFTRFRTTETYREREKMTIRVTWWLKTRGFIH